MSNSSFPNSGGSGVWVFPGTVGSANATFNWVRVENNLRGIKLEDAITTVVRYSVVASNPPGNAEPLP